MNDLLFRDDNQLYFIELSKEVYMQMLQYCDQASPNETGGILIGRYSSDLKTAYIMQITPAPEDSKQMTDQFYRGVNGLQAILDVAWDEGQHYLGEWHSRPNGSSFPSEIDKKQMIDLSHNKQLKCPEPILVVVGRNKNIWDLSIHLYTNDQEIGVKVYE